MAGAVLALGAFYATMGSRSTNEGSSDPAKAVADRAPAKSGKAAKPAKDASAKESSAKNPKAAAPTDSAAAGSAGPDAGSPTRRGVPPEVAAALVGNRTVVLFFFQRGSADDDATAEAVAAVRRRGGAKVFSAPISRLAEYRAVTEGVGVSQAPAVVIVRKGRSARLVEGFVDPETLVQQVADAR